MKCGWVRLHRSLIKNSIWTESLPEEKVVLITSLLLAIHKGDDNNSSPGEFLIDKEFFLNMCGKDVKEEGLINSLKFLQEREFLHFDYDKKNFLIRIINWKSYQERDYEGWIKLDRDILEDYLWISSNVKQKVLIIIFFLLANYKENTWYWSGEKHKVLKGELITSSSSLIKYGGEGFTRQVVRCGIKKFEKLGFISYKTDRNSHKIRINNWVKYNLDEEGDKDFKGTKENSKRNHTRTKEKPNKNHERTTNKNDNKEKNEDNDKNENKSIELNFKNKDVYDIYSSSGFGLINLIIIEKLDEDIKIFSKEWVVEAIKIAARNNKHSLSYVEGILNIIVSAFVNIIDFCAWFIAWIPGLNVILDYVYRSPDLVERMLPFIFGGLGGHRNFITHSVLNPIFLIFIGVSYLFIRNIKSDTIASIIKVIVGIIGFTFVCHLLADTMPIGWRGTANIKVYFFVPIMTMPAFFSKLWLFVNSILSAMVVLKVASED